MGDYTRGASNLMLQPTKNHRAKLSVTSGLKLWLRADRGAFTDTGGTSLATATGDKVLNWTNLAIASAASDVDTPTQLNGETYGPELRIGDLNGQRVLSFDGIADHFRIPNSAVDLNFLHKTGIFDLFIVLKKNTSLRQGFFTNTNSSNNAGFDFEFTTGDKVTMIVLEGGGVANGFKTTATGITNGTWTPLQINGNGTTLSMNKNLTSFIAGDQVAYSNTPFGTGDCAYKTGIGVLIDADAAVYPFNGSFAEILLYNRSLSAGELALMRSYLNARYGFSL